LEHRAQMESDRDMAFASARLALARAHKRHIQVRQHRAINHLHMGPYLLLQTLLLPAVFCGLLWWGQSYLFELWQTYILVWAKQLDIPLVASTGSATASKLGLIWSVGNHFDDLPSGGTLAITGLLTLVVFMISFGMNGRMFPLKYLLRILCVIQGFALVFFWLQPSGFPYDISNHVNDLAIMGYVLLMAIPVMLALGYYVLNIDMGTKLLHTALILLYFIVMVPFQVIGHVLILQNFSLLFMPILYICFGTLFDMLIFVALYSWAASTAPAQATS
jgi:hypothetical protein